MPVRLLPFSVFLREEPYMVELRQREREDTKNKDDEFPGNQSRKKK